MPILQLDLAKSHLRVDHDDEDAYIQLLIDTAQEQAQAYLNRSIVADQAGADALDVELRPIVANNSIQAAMLLMLGDWYANREDGKSDMPLTSRRMLDPYRLGQGV